MTRRDSPRWHDALHRGSRLALVACAFPVICAAAESPGPPRAEPGKTVLSIEGASFLLNGKPAFLLGISYYGGLGAPEEFIRRDLDDLERSGFNWLRVWATWGALDSSPATSPQIAEKLRIDGCGRQPAISGDVSAVNAKGGAREPFLGKLERLVAECDRRGMVVDVTLTRGKGAPSAAGDGPLADFASHRQAVETLVNALKSRRNWYLDLANERDVRDARHVPAEELKALRELVRRIDAARLVTASFGGHDLGEEDVREAVLTVGVDFLCPHRPRDSRSPGQTEAKTRECLALMEKVGRAVPVHHQEPFRRGYTQWEPVAADFLTDLRGAVAGGAAGWCFHNGQERSTPGNEPRRSFDLRSRRLLEQLDVEELKVVAEARRCLPSTSGN